MNDQHVSKQGNRLIKISRRNFLKVAGTVAIGVSTGGCAESSGEQALFMKPEEINPNMLPSAGYLLVDTKKCQGCVSCMLACSLVHEGEENMSLARIQVMQNPFGKYPDDISLGLCRQCLTPACVDACPEGALYINKEKGNIRMITKERCIGCKQCIDACPYEPGRTMWNFSDEHALKCDLCIDTPFWKKQGGVNGKQACISVCPVQAIKFTGKVPAQKGDIGYNVNLRDKNWAHLGYPVD